MSSRVPAQFFEYFAQFTEPSHAAVSECRQKDVNSPVACVRRHLPMCVAINHG